MPIINGVTILLPAPDGYIVDFQNPQRQAVPEAYWVAGIGTSLSLLLMAQRVYTKAILHGYLELEDCKCLYTSSLAWGWFVADMFGAGVGGIHAWELSIERYQTFMTSSSIQRHRYTSSGSSAKISLLVFYKRIFPQRWLQWSVWILAGVIVAYTAGIFFPLIFACQPTAKSWDSRITNGACINGATLYIATAVANIISDVFVLVLPIQPLIKLQMKRRRQKIGLVALFAVGSLTVVTSFVRFFLLLDMLRSLDQSWAISWASVWIIIEANLLIICAAFPTLKKFIRHIAPKLLGESSYGRGTEQAVSGGVANRGTNGTNNSLGHEFLMETLPQGTSVKVAGGSYDLDDGSSETAIILPSVIIQTRTVTIMNHHWLVS
ncbi:uncharacterized protein CTRU02_215259 [Colletotrichum truncatum]|uniref:Integral membrane protein n=1 Tax=Colletotrichum truncatum TaxID=5467 RepID=A0ACC3YD99_COLTU|nr:uncharacterized protein CTRU02_12299 [Colletotrichum truncatum]KAF6784838.1 integral membrane protein [Colletotrichum truncatum]